MRGSQRPTEKVIYYQVKSKDLECPIFKSNSEGESNETNLSGHLISLEFKTFEYANFTKKGHTIEFKLYDPDADERYLVNVGWTQLGRSFLNQLLNSPLPFEEPMELSLYTKDDYPQISLTYNRQWPGVRFKWKEHIAPLIQEYEDPNSASGTSKSYQKVNGMLKKEVEKTLLNAIAANAKRFAAKEPAAEKKEAVVEEDKTQFLFPEPEEKEAPPPPKYYPPPADDLPF